MINFNHKIILLPIYLVISLFQISCIVPEAYHAYPPIKKPTTPFKIYDATFDNVFEASVKAFDETGLDIFKTDKKRGYVEGGFKPAWFTSSAQTWGAFIEAVSQHRIKVSIDYQKGPWGSAFHKDRTDELFDEIEEELKKDNSP